MNKLYYLIKKPFIFLFQWRPYSVFRFLMYFLMFSAVIMFYYGINEYDVDIIMTIFLSIIVLYSGFFAAIIWNDICDQDIDEIVHPNRAVPMKRIGKRKFFRIALIFSFLVFLFSFLINWKCFVFVVLAALFVAIHNKFLRRKVKLAAYSEIVTPMQWIIVPIFGFLAVNGSNITHLIILSVFTYVTDAAHDYPEGIHDAEGDRRAGIKTFTTSFGKKTAAKISFLMLVFSGITGISLFHFTILGVFFLIPFISYWLYAIYHSFIFIQMDDYSMEKNGLMMGSKIYTLFWMSYVLIFIDLIIKNLIFRSI